MATETKTPLTPAPQYSVHDKQKHAIQSQARYKVLEWGRRAGKNITAAIELIEHGRAPWESQWGSDDPSNTKIWWVARSYDQAEKYGFLPMLSAIPNNWIQGQPTRSPPYSITLTNGVTYEYRTYDHPETLQGAGVDKMLVDEADYMKDSLWYDDLEPMLMDTTGAVMFISKPVRHGSYFQQIADRGRSGEWPEYYYSHATSADNPFIDEDPMDKRGSMPDAKFRQQYLAELPEDGGQVFTGIDSNFFTGEYSLVGEMDEGVGEVYVEKVETDEGDMVWPEHISPPFSVGVDIARTRDYRVTLALDGFGQVCYYKRAQNESWDGIQSHIERVHAEYPGVVVPDASRDNKLISDLWHAGVEMDPTKFSPQEKLRLIDDLITAVETGELTAPDTPLVDQLRSEMRMMEKEVTRAGYAKYHAPSGGHDDTVDALALAYKGIESAATSSATARVGEDEWDGQPTDNLNDIANEIARQHEKARRGW